MNDIDLMLNAAYEPDKLPAAADPRRVASHDDTALYFGTPNVDAVYANLRAKGVDVKEPKVAPYKMKQLYVRDPDGFSLCFQWKAEA